MRNAAASRLVLGTYSEEEVVSVARSALQEIGGRVSCGFLFASADYRPHLEDFLELIQLQAHVPILVGSSASGLVGSGSEVEQASGFSLLLLHLPETQLQPVHISQSALEQAQGADDWRHRVKEADAWMVLANPLTFAIDPWLDQWNKAFPGCPSLGGLASGGKNGDDIFLFLDRKPLDGAVALGFRGGVRIRPLVSQGCKPIGEPLTITQADKNIVFSLGSKPAYEVLSAAFESLPPLDRARAQGNLFAGIASSEYLEDFKQGDFLIRNILGASPETGGVAIGAFPRVGQTLQYQLRDRRSASEDLLHAARSIPDSPFASLMFCCNGRGQHLFGEPSHDAHVLASVFGPHASGGLFCNGEIGPAAGSNFIHGYSVVAALFCEP